MLQPAALRRATIGGAGVLCVIITTTVPALAVPASLTFAGRRRRVDPAGGRGSVMTVGKEAVAGFRIVPRR